MGGTMIFAHAMADVQELDTQPKLGENATPEEVEKEQAEIDAAKKEAADLAAQPKDSLEEVVPSAKVHEAVKQTLVEEEKLYSLMSFNFRKGAEGKYAYADYYVRHMNRNVMVSTVNGPMDRQDATYKVLHALCEPATRAGSPTTVLSVYAELRRASSTRRQRNAPALLVRCAVSVRQCAWLK